MIGASISKGRVLPDNTEAEVRVLDVMNYVIGAIHMQGFARIFTTDKVTPNESEYEWIKQQRMDIIDKGFAVVGNLLSAQGYVTESFSIADAALFYVEFWADKTGIELPDVCRKHYRQMLQRAAVRRVLMEEG